MDWGTSEKTLFGVFIKFGDLDRVVLVKDHHTGRSRGFGFVYYNDLEGAIKAREAMDGQEIDGRTCRVDFSLTSRKTEPFRWRRVVDCYILISTRLVEIWH